jgi:hypothetical protein
MHKGKIVERIVGDEHAKKQQKPITNIWSLIDEKE